MAAFLLKTDPTSRRVDEIIHERARLIDMCRALIAELDDNNPQNWAQIIAAAREGGLEKDTLCEAFSCAWSTILRWQAGRNAPGPFARGAIKQKLLEMLAELRDLELARLRIPLTRAPVA